MKRRDTLRLIPLGLTGFSAMFNQASAFAQTNSDNPDKYSMTYVNRVKQMLHWVRANQMENILEGAYSIARAVEDGRQVWSCWDLGHTNSSDLFENRNGKPSFIVPGFDSEKAKNGDLVLANFPWPAGYVEELGKRDFFVIGGPCPWGGDIPRHDLIKSSISKNKIRPHADIWIETNSDHIGAQVEIPGSNAKLGPESGPLNGTILWMMVADACRILARKGKNITIEGDEPKLSGNRIPWINLDNPLMDDYFDTIFKQLDRIEAELGDLRKMAKMVVDTLLSGGQCFFYSRYYESLAGEAVGRRGGFSFAQGLADGRMDNGTSKDCCIFGTYAPDDKVDLKNLAAIKKKGMRVASIGPVTRDQNIPDGPAVFKETEVHAGRMYDTYGLFAIPGMDRKVCPTSGSMATSILWVMSVEIAEEIIRRTGNTPAINCNGALLWADEHNAQMSAMFRERGY